MKSKTAIDFVNTEDGSSYKHGFVRYSSTPRDVAFRQYLQRRFGIDKDDIPALSALMKGVDIFWNPEYVSSYILFISLY